MISDIEYIKEAGYVMLSIGRDFVPSGALYLASEFAQVQAYALPVNSCSIAIQAGEGSVRPISARWFYLPKSIPFSRVLVYLMLIRYIKMTISSQFCSAIKHTMVM